MEASTIWWLAAGAVVVAELLTGTFYLLMVALGLVAAALAAHLGLASALQIVSAAIVGGGAVVACYLVRKKRPGDPSARALIPVKQPRTPYSWRKASIGSSPAALRAGK